MGLFGIIKKSFQCAMACTKMDDFLNEHIDTIICRHWKKRSQGTPTNIGSVSLGEVAEYELVHTPPTGTGRHSWGYDGYGRLIFVNHNREVVPWQIN